jgi:hypothetical protein
VVEPGRFGSSRKKEAAARRFGNYELWVLNAAMIRTTLFVGRIPLATFSFFQKPFWEDPSDWLSHSSVMTVGKVTTPTLLMTGVLDRRTPMPQTEEYYAALKVRGVPVKLLQFEGEYYGTASKPSNFIRTQLYMMSWFKRYARTAAGKSTLVAASAGSPDESTRAGNAALP